MKLIKTPNEASKPKGYRKYEIYQGIARFSNPCSDTLEDGR